MPASLLFLLSLISEDSLTKPLENYKPSPEELKSNYVRADSIRQEAAGKVSQLSLTPYFVGDAGFWYVKEGKNRSRRYTWFDLAKGEQSDLFDHAKLAGALQKTFGGTFNEDRLTLNDLSAGKELRSFAFVRDGKSYLFSTDDYLVKEGKLGAVTVENNRIARVNMGELRVVEGRIELKRNGSREWERVGTETGFVRAQFSPDGNVIVGTKVIPGDRKSVSTIRSTGPDLRRGVLETRLYDQPGDKLDTAEYYLFDTLKLTGQKILLPEVICGGQPWSNAPGIDWWRPSGSSEWSFLIDYVERGYQAYRVQLVSTVDGRVTDVVNEREKTFFDTTKMIFRRLNESPSILWRSERDGWGHLYKISQSGQVEAQLTKGEFVVRGLSRVDESDKRIWFMANGKESGDPYFQYMYTVGLGGGEMKLVTPGEGNHEPIIWSPGYQWVVDKWSSPQRAPQFQVVKADGSQRYVITGADDSELASVGVSRPESFVAKGRDGKTDIWGLIFRPSHFDENKIYPVIENIYAGPHDSHVPKSYSPIFSSQQLAELGFIVVQIDGMGTNNRGKAFHDVCWRNLKDAGFPDRILWMQAANKRYPQMDISRVGIFGTSAGGQNSAGAMLFHPEFYKVAVSSCGCHDNRIDKFWWNEQWMGYPVGPWYAESSNIDNAAKLRGKLMLMVGEVDSNVPPESTFRFADALMRAGREFEMVHLPGQNHTGGGTYGERKRRDFFVRHLLGVDPPNWNGSN